MLQLFVLLSKIHDELEKIHNSNVLFLKLMLSYNNKREIRNVRRISHGAEKYIFS